MKFIWFVLLSCFVSFQALAVQPEVLVLKPESFIRITEDFNDMNAAKFIRDLLTYPSNDVLVYIDSPGGDVLAGIRMIEVVRAAKAANPKLKITCAVGSAASMAFYFLQLACDERLVSPTTILMQHQAGVGIQGKLRDINKRLKLYKTLQEWLDEESAKRLKISVEKLRENVVDDWWMSGEEAVKNNAADKIVHVLCSPELAAAPPSKETQKHACPLIYMPIPPKDSAESKEKAVQK